MDINELRGVLKQFTVGQVSEVYRTDQDGLNPRPVAYLADPDVAEGWRGTLRDKDFHQMRLVWVLTNGAEAFLINPSSVSLADDEAARLEVRKNAIAKLTDAERKALGV